MARKRIIQTIVLGAFVLISLYTIWNQWGNESVQVLQPGVEAPDFTLYDTNGQPVQLSTFRGKTVILNFWGHWCEPCQEEMPTLESVAQDYKDQNVVVLGVHLGQEAVTVNHFMEQFGITFPVVYDTSDLAVSKLYGIDPIPDTFIIRPDGIIQDARVGGPVPKQWLTDTIHQIQNETGGEGG